MFLSPSLTLCLFWLLSNFLTFFHNLNLKDFIEKLLVIWFSFFPSKLCFNFRILLLKNGSFHHKNSSLLCFLLILRKCEESNYFKRSFYNTLKFPPWDKQVNIASFILKIEDSLFPSNFL